MNLPTVIVDDEQGSRESLRNLIGRYTKGLKVTGMADDVQPGIELIGKLRPEVVFLDIRLRTGTGFDLLEGLPDWDFHLVFTTAYDEYAIRAFKFSAIDYLLKPIDIDELENVADRIKRIEKSKTREGLIPNLLHNIRNTGLRISIATESSFEFVNIRDIEYLEASGAYTNTVLASGSRIFASKRLKEFEQLLSEHGFFRIHHSYLVNLRLVQRYIKSTGGSVIMRSGAELPVSRRKKEGFLAAMDRYLSH